MASTPPKPPDPFLSYTRFDDRHDGGAISEFCRRLASAVRAVTGVPFKVFQDVGGIGIGEHWPGKLDQMLDEARFFIPIVTPSYFTSKPCRDEPEKFLRAEAERGRNDLVLPIYYIESEVLEDDELRAADPLASTLYERQRQDWRELRFEPFEAKEVRRSLEALAREIVKARRRPIRLAEEEARRKAEEARLLAKEKQEQRKRREPEAAKAKPTVQREGEQDRSSRISLSRPAGRPELTKTVDSGMVRQSFSPGGASRRRGAGWSSGPSLMRRRAPGYARSLTPSGPRRKPAGGPRTLTA
jgi:TIR domain